MTVIKKPLGNLLNEAIKNKITFNTLFFTSNNQPTNQSQSFYQNIKHALSLKKEASQQKSYFSKNLLDDFNQQEKSSEVTEKKQTNSSAKKIALFSYLSAAIILILSIITWNHAYQKTLKKISVVQATLNQPIILTSKDSEQDMFERLKALRMAQPLLERSKTWVLQKHANSMYQKTSSAYKKLINTTFVPFLNKTLTNAISHNLNNPEALYPALKAYLTLNEYQYFDNTNIKQWFANHWINLYTTSEQNNLNQDLSYLLTEEKYINYNINIKLIKQARDKLANIPFAQLAVIMLEANDKNKPLNLPYANSPNLGFTIGKSTVPSIYTLLNFQNTLSQKIPAVAKTLEQKDWVSDVKIPKKQQNIEQIQNSYLQNYTKTWNNVLSSIQLTPSSSIKDAIKKMQLLTSQQSSLWQLLRIATYNTGANSNIQTIETYITPSFIELSSALNTTGDNNSLKSIVNNMSNYLTLINSQANPEQAAYTILTKKLANPNGKDAINYLKEASKSLPNPINQWVNELAENSTQTLLGMASNYLNNLWISDVVPTYNQSLNGNFPFFRNSDRDISLENFNNFFQPNGVIDTFFMYYLKPFVNTSKPYWVWKTINGNTLSIDQKNLDIFIRASLIKKMFYSDQSETPKITLDVLPLNFAKNNLPFELTLNGTTHYFKPHQANKKITLQWPFQQDLTVQLTIDNPPPNKKTIITQTGPWAWFRLLNQATIVNTSNPREFKVIFEQNNKKSAEFLILLPSPINPFVPGIIDQFRCPSNLK